MPTGLLPDVQLHQRHAERVAPSQKVQKPSVGDDAGPGVAQAAVADPKNLNEVALRGEVILLLHACDARILATRKELLH